MTAQWVFWLGIGLVAYAYAGYPWLVSMLARMHGQAPREDDTCPPLTVVVAAYNEQARIAARVLDILGQDYPADRLRVLVVNDGSSDDTARMAAVDDTRVRVLPLSGNMGKAAALNAALEQAGTELVAFADARQRFTPGALRFLVAPFSDPRVGAVSGALVIQAGAAGDSAHDLGVYWRMEQKLRANEALLGWLHGVSGAIHAVRRGLFRPMPTGTVLDDMWIPLHVLRGGHRVWMAQRAVACDQASATAREEFSRKLRTLAGNWQLIARMPALLDPWRNPVFFAWFSHKFLRLLAPWALLAALVASALSQGPFYRVAFHAQWLAYAGASLALCLPRLARHVPLLPASGTFLLLNLAALLALPASFLDASRLWKKH